MASNPTAMSPQQIMAQSAQMANWCVANGLEMSQITDTRTLTGVIPGQVTTIPMRPVGLLKRVVLEVSFNVAQSAAETLTRTALGPANIFSSVNFTDLNNNARIQTTGWHLHILATMRRGAAFGAVFTNDSPTSMGAKNFNAVVCPSSVTTSQLVRFFYEIPISYSDNDLRGVVNLAAVNASAQLQLTVNPNLVAPSTMTDAISSVFQSSTSAVGVISNFTIVTYQEYLDQIPPSMVPPIESSVMYQLSSTVPTGITANQEFGIPYANFKEFLSTTVLFDNNGTLNPGTDINYFAMQSANITNFFKKTPWKATLDVRELIGDDLPPGMYYFDHRRRPINTIQTGNVQLLINASSVASANGTFPIIGWEMMSQLNVALRAQSLPSG